MQAPMALHWFMTAWDHATKCGRARQEVEAHTLTTHQVDKIGAKCLVVQEQIDSIEVSRLHRTNSRT